MQCVHNEFQINGLPTSPPSWESEMHTIRVLTEMSSLKEVVHLQNRVE
jgi:hypothetical protein